MFNKTHSNLHPKETIFSLVFFLPLLFFVVSSVKTQENEEERSILLKLKKELRNSSYLESWNSNNSHHCNWEGIECDAHGSVSVIHFASMDIPGKFPISILNCSKLQVLDLSYNQFVGNIPNDIDRLSNLREINLNSNHFSGNIPSSIGNLQYLQTLHLGNNLLTSFPPEIGNLSSLEYLYFYFNDFLPSKIPNEFIKLIKLRHLYMEKSNFFIFRRTI